jgi:hypothetical protein
MGRFSFGSGHVTDIIEVLEVENLPISEGVIIPKL